MSRFSFEDIRAFSVAELWDLRTAITERTALAHDFQVAGLDGQEFMAAYAQKFDVNMKDFDWIEYFGPEAGGNPLGPPLYLWQRYIRGIPARDLLDLPELTLGHLVECANEGQWKRPAQHA